jgi:hypothetical protein
MEYPRIDLSVDGKHMIWRPLVRVIEAVSSSSMDRAKSGELWHRLLGGQRLIMGDYVREMGATTGAPAAGGG